MSTSNEKLPAEFKAIPTDYQETVRQYLTTVFTNKGAATDEDEYVILEELLGKAERGELILDETGNPSNQLLPLEWNDERVSTELGLSRAINIGVREYLLVGAMIVGVIGVVLYFFGFFSSEPAPDDLVAQIVEEVVEEVLPEATLAVTPISQQSLEIATSLGGSITIGQPRTLDIEGKRLNQTFGIVPVRPNQNGSMNFLKEEDRDSAVVWVQDTVINYVIGGSSEMMHGLELNDTIRLRSSTGQVMSFTIAEIFDTEPQKAEIFSQNNSPGITLFELPAQGAVRVARAIYQSTNEVVENTNVIVGKIGEKVERHPEIDVIVNWVTFNQLPNGLLSVEAKGVYTGQKEGIVQELPVIAALENNETQYAPIEGGLIAQKGNWAARWEVPVDEVATLDLLLKPVTSQMPIRFDLSEIAHPRNTLRMQVIESHWDVDQKHGVFTVEIENFGAGDAYIFAHEVSAKSIQTSDREQPTVNSNLGPSFFVGAGAIEQITFEFEPFVRDGEVVPIVIQVLDSVYTIELPQVLAAGY